MAVLFCPVVDYPLLYHWDGQQAVGIKHYQKKVCLRNGKHYSISLECGTRVAVGLFLCLSAWLETLYLIILILIMILINTGQSSLCEYQRPGESVMYLVQR